MNWRFHHARWNTYLADFLRDLRYALRMLRKNPGFTSVAIITLALGIGANTAIFSVVNGILFEPLPYASSSRLVTIERISVPDAQEIQQQCTAFEQLAVYQLRSLDKIRTSLMPDLAYSTQVSADFFPMLGVQPLLGRPILPADTQPGGENVVVLSYKFWQTDFAGDTEIVGRSFYIEEKPFKVIGVMPPEFDFGIRRNGLWKPHRYDPKFDSDRDFQMYSIVARLKKGVNLEQANAQLKTLSARLAAQYPETGKDQDKRNDFVAVSIKGEMVSNVRTGLLILLAAVGFVLLIACVNVSALLLPRGFSRQKEIAIRRALGAPRSRLVRQFLSESLLLAMAAGALGLLLSVWGIRLLRALAPPYMPRIERIALDANVLWFTLGISLLAAIFFGLAPALEASSSRRGSAPTEGAANSFAGIGTPRRFQLRSAMIVAEVSLAMILVVGAALMVSSFEKLIHVDTGLRTDHVLTMDVVFTGTACSGKTPEQCQLLFADALDRIRSVPGVQHAAVTRGFALEGGKYGMRSLHVQGKPGDQAAGTGVVYHSVTPEYFEILGISILNGRDFNSGDTYGSPRVALVNQSFARKYLSADPLGKLISVSSDKSGNPEWIQVVGLVSDDRDFQLKEQPEPLYYIPRWQDRSNGFANFILRTSGDPMAVATAVQRQIWAVDKDAPIQDVETLDHTVARSVAEPKFQAALLASFGALGLLLAIVGIYGVISYSVAQRTREMGIRMALGAQSRNLIRLVVGQGAGLALIGIIIGIGGALLLTRFLQSLLFEVKPTDPTTIFGVSILFLLVAVLASFLPARRATRVDPMVALRHE